MEGFEPSGCRRIFIGTPQTHGVEPCFPPVTAHVFWSGRLDLNQRSSVPKTDGLTKLSHVPDIWRPVGGIEPPALG